ncbi:MAG: hypothetical protein KIS66_05995 [Fimbriimonadaceae bacterium]|nr:hypothetical protein [Fimbriimonadaceae bacterium]
MVLLAALTLTPAMLLGQTQVSVHEAAAREFLDDLVAARLLPHAADLRLNHIVEPWSALAPHHFVRLGNGSLYYSVAVGAGVSPQITCFGLLSSGYDGFEPGPYANPDDAHVLEAANVLHRLSRTLGDSAFTKRNSWSNEERTSHAVFRLLHGAIVGSGGSDGGLLELDRRTGYLLSWSVSPTYAPPPDLRPRVPLDQAFASVAQALFARPGLLANGRIIALPQDDPSLYRPKVCLPTKQGTPLSERHEALKNQGQSVLVWHLHVYEATPGGERLFSNHWVGMVDAITGEVISVGRISSGGGGAGGPSLPRLDLLRLKAGMVEVGGRRTQTPAFGLTPTDDSAQNRPSIAFRYAGANVAFSGEWDVGTVVTIGEQRYRPSKSFLTALRTLR